MDPLSITVAVITLISAVSTSLNTLKGISGAPGVIFDLSDEVTQLGVLLEHVQAHIQKGDNGPVEGQPWGTYASTEKELLSMVNKAASSLLEIDGVLKRIRGEPPSILSTEENDDPNKVIPRGKRNRSRNQPSTSSFKIKWMSWRKTTTKLSNIRDKLRDIKLNITPILLVVNM